MPTVEKHTFGEALDHLLEEEKRRLEKLIVQCRSEISFLSGDDEDLKVTSELDDLAERLKWAEMELERLGGDTRDRLRKVLITYCPEQDSEWFVQGYGEFERKYLVDKIGELQSRFSDKEGNPLPIDQLVVDDRGMGNGRSLRMLLEIIEDKYNKSIAQRFAKNIYGIDLMEKNVDEADTLFRKKKYGLPRENLSTGSYLDPSKKRVTETKDGEKGFYGKKAHLILCMMHSCFYNVTEEDWCTFFKNVRDDLHTGGLFVFDTVPMPRNQGDEIASSVEKVTLLKQTTEVFSGVLKKVKSLAQFETLRELYSRVFSNVSHMAQLDDLKDLYTRLWLDYCESNQQFMPEGINLLKMPRYTIFDNTTSKGFYWREVPTIPFINHIIKKIGGGLKITQPLKTRPPEINNEDAVRLGREWMKANGLEKKYRSIIKDRVIKGIVDPGQLLGKPIRKSEKSSRRIIEELLDYLAQKMVQDYQNLYITIERTDEGDDEQGLLAA